jgi:ABC-type phosphate transport system substrate-binding protein
VSDSRTTKKSVIQNIGSDTMVNLAQAWAVAYAKVEPNVSVEHTPGQPPAHVQKYIDWVLSPPGQKIVEETGYVPLPKT